jgi:hypothetical protein
MIVRPDPFELEQLGPDSGENLLDQRPRRHRAPLGGPPLRSRQCLPVHLACRGEGKRSEHHESGRYHVVRQPLLQRLSQRRDCEISDDIGDQPSVVREILAHHHDGLTDSGERGQRRLDLPQFDAEAAELDLVIAPTQKFQVTVGLVAGAIAGPVEARAGPAERVGHEALGREGRAVEIAAGEARASQVQLAGYPDRDRTDLWIEHVGPGVGHRPADGRLVAVDTPEVRGRGINGGLRRAVAVEEVA